jgi:hypothetical protein
MARLYRAGVTSSKIGLGRLQQQVSGFDFGLWTRRIVQTLILEKLGVEPVVTDR